MCGNRAASRATGQALRASAPLRARPQLLRNCWPMGSLALTTSARSQRRSTAQPPSESLTSVPLLVRACPRRGDPCGRPWSAGQRPSSHQRGRPQGSPLRQIPPTEKASPLLSLPPCGGVEETEGLLRWGAGLTPPPQQAISPGGNVGAQRHFGLLGNVTRRPLKRQLPLAAKAESPAFGRSQPCSRGLGRVTRRGAAKRSSREAA